MLLGRVEGDTLVDETEDEGIVFEEDFEGDGALSAFGIGIADGIGQCFVEGKVELEGDIGRKAVGIGNLIEEGCKLGYFGEGIIESECEHGDRFLGGSTAEPRRTGPGMGLGLGMEADAEHGDVVALVGKEGEVVDIGINFLDDVLGCAGRCA